MANLKNTTINDTSALQLPVGTTAERPGSPVDGYMRFNSEESKVEYYSNGEWLFLPSGPNYEQGLVYTWYNTSSYYSSNSHPTSESALDNFFNSSLSGVSLGGSGNFSGSINWGDNSQSGAGGTAGSKPSYLPGDGFSWMVEGYIYAPESGTYTFGCDGDDAMDVHVNGTRVAYWYDGHGFEGSWSGDPDQETGTISLQEDTYYTFRARMEEGSGGDGMQVGWKKPSDGSISLIPSTNFFREI